MVTDDEQPGEDPEILAAVAEATEKLRVRLLQLNIEVDYIEADWKDDKSLVEESFRLIQKHPGWLLHYINGDTFGIDSNYVFFTSAPVSDEVVEEIARLIVDEGAELLEPPKPKCPKCGKEISFLEGSYKAIVSAIASVVDGELNIQLQEDVKPYEIIDEDSVIWCCPECDETLFSAEDADMIDKMIVFLKG